MRYLPKHIEDIANRHEGNTVLFRAVPLVATLGARFYYLHAEGKGVVLGLFMFTVAGSLDAIVTVPLLIMPAGGSYKSFYGDPGFWIIGIESRRSPSILSARSRATRPSPTRRVPLPRRPSNLCTTSH